MEIVRKIKRSMTRGWNPTCPAGKMSVEHQLAEGNSWGRPLWRATITAPDGEELSRYRERTDDAARDANEALFVWCQQHRCFTEADCYKKRSQKSKS